MEYRKVKNAVCSADHSFYPFAFLFDISGFGFVLGIELIGWALIGQYYFWYAVSVWGWWNPEYAWAGIIPLPMILLMLIIPYPFTFKRPFIGFRDGFFIGNQNIFNWLVRTVPYTSYDQIDRIEMGPKHVKVPFLCKKYPESIRIRLKDGSEHLIHNSYNMERAVIYLCGRLPNKVAPDVWDFLAVMEPEKHETLIRRTYHNKLRKVKGKDEKKPVKKKTSMVHQEIAEEVDDTFPVSSTGTILAFKTRKMKKGSEANRMVDEETWPRQWAPGTVQQIGIRPYDENILDVRHGGYLNAKTNRQRALDNYIAAGLSIAILSIVGILLLIGLFHQYFSLGSWETMGPCIWMYIIYVVLYATTMVICIVAVRGTKKHVEHYHDLILFEDGFFRGHVPKEYYVDDMIPVYHYQHIKKVELRHTIDPMYNQETRWVQVWIEGYPEAKIMNTPDKAKLGKILYKKNRRCIGADMAFLMGKVGPNALKEQEPEEEPDQEKKVIIYRKLKKEPKKKEIHLHKAKKANKVLDHKLRHQKEAQQTIKMTDIIDERSFFEEIGLEMPGDYEYEEVEKQRNGKQEASLRTPAVKKERVMDERKKNNKDHKMRVVKKKEPEPQKEEEEKKEGTEPEKKGHVVKEGFTDDEYI